MKSYLKELGYRVSDQRKEGYKKLQLLSINNNDGTPRWIWNAHNTKPLFLKFYSATTIRARIFSLALKLVFWLGIQQWVFKKTNIYYKEGFSDSFFDIEKEWALFTGTVGPNNKPMLYSGGYFYKMAQTEKAESLIKNETEVLRLLNNTTRYHLNVPKYESVNDRVLKISDVSVNGKRWQQFSYLHSWVLFEMDKIYPETHHIGDWKYLKELISDYRSIKDRRIPHGILKKMNLVLEQINDKDEIELGFAHGDFTPWNTFVNSRYSLSAYDWELASMEKPKGFDFFHFIIQGGVLDQKKGWKDIYKELKEKNGIAFNFNAEKFHQYLKYYLVVNILQYLKVYSQQTNWHPQVYWLFATWDDALNLFVEQNYTSRELIILDFFDRLKHESYATLKFPKKAPEKLALTSDIDVVIDKKVSHNVINYLKGHSQIHKVIVEKKSFMTQLKIITKDYKILSVDLIHQLKWKNMEILSRKDILKRSYTNSYGVKVASYTDTLRYIILFYKLNLASIPERYSYSGKNVVLMLSKIKLDRTLYYSIDQEKTSAKRNIIKALREVSTNQGWNYIANTFRYFADAFSGKGFVITFSGVDGAGKSTVITNIAEMVEEKFRKPVKVLRHRPSILPILSVYTKGKEKAKEDVVNALPRQGENNSFTSSVFRYIYYYIDYFLGQFVVYFKYVLRGHVVIYDRYYFDFIADSRRSNIKLPKFLTQFGYYFLLKPKYNFFLYADPEDILNRKKELSYGTIRKLTGRYQKLFQSLGKNSKGNVYQLIKNEDLVKTLEQVNNTIVYVL